MVEVLSTRSSAPMVRAVTEAVQDLAARSFAGARHLPGRGDAPDAGPGKRCVLPDLALRDAFAFLVEEMFLVHRDTGSVAAPCRRRWANGFPTVTSSAAC